MPFGAEVLRELEKLDYCEGCGAYEPEVFDAHSGSQLHLKKITRGNNKGRYKCQSVPESMQALVGDRGTRTVSAEMGEYFTIIDGRKSDAVRFCPKCHREVHNAANQWARHLNPYHQGKVAPPEVLYQTTRLIVQRGKTTIYDEPVYDEQGNLMRLLGCDSELY